MSAYATLAQLRDYLDIDAANTGDDALLTMFLDNATAIIDTQTHRTFVSTASETHLHDALRNVEGATLWLGGDLCQLDSVTNGDGTTIALNKIVTEPPNGGRPIYALTLKSNAGISWTYNNDHEDAIGVAGRWAYSIAAPAPIVQATLRLAAWLYRQRDNANDLDRALIVGNTTITPAQIPADVALILKPYIKRLV